MNGTTKFIIGAIGTSLMAMASHSAFGLGQGFVKSLESKANAAIAAQGTVAGVTAAAVTDPSLQRVIVLSGAADEGDRAKLIALVKAIPGVKDVRWAEEDSAVASATINTDQTPATAEAVKNCQADVDRVIKGKTILFESGAASIKPESIALIDALAAELGQCAGTTVEVAGHTDVTGSPTKNQTLSETRANAVVAELVNRGIPAGRLMPKGYGSSKPVQQGSDAASNSANRRIEFYVTTAAAPTAQ